MLREFQKHGPWTDHDAHAHRRAKNNVTWKWYAHRQVLMSLVNYCGCLLLYEMLREFQNHWPLTNHNVHAYCRAKINRNSIHAIPCDMFLVRRAHSPITWHKKSTTCWHCCCLLFINSWFNTSVVSLHLHKPLNVIFPGDVFSVCDTRTLNTNFEGAVTRQWPY